MNIYKVNRNNGRQGLMSKISVTVIAKDGIYAVEMYKSS